MTRRSRVADERPLVLPRSVAVSNAWPDGSPRIVIYDRIQCGQDGPVCRLVAEFDRQVGSLIWLNVFPEGSRIIASIFFERDLVSCVYFTGRERLTLVETYREDDKTHDAVAWILGHMKEITRRGRPEGTTLLSNVTDDDLRQWSRELHDEKRAKRAKDPTLIEFAGKVADKIEEGFISERTLSEELKRRGMPWYELKSTN